MEVCVSVAQGQVRGATMKYIKTNKLMVRDRVHTSSLEHASSLGGLAIANESVIDICLEVPRAFLSEIPE